MKLLIMLHGSVHFTAILFLLQRLALVILLLASAESNVNLGAALVIDEYEGRDYGEARRLGVLRQRLLRSSLRSRFASWLLYEP